MKNGYTIDILTIVDKQEIVEMDGEVFKVYESVGYKQIFKRQPLEKLSKYCLISD